MLGTARHSQGSGEYFPTERTIAYSWRAKDYAWNFYPGTGYTGGATNSIIAYAAASWTIAYWFKFVDQGSGLGYSNHAQLIASPAVSDVLYRRRFPYVSKTRVGISDLFRSSTEELATVNLSNDVWYSAVFSYASGSNLDIWIQGQRVYQGGPSTISGLLLPQHDQVDSELLRMGLDGSRYADGWFDDQYIDFNQDRNKLRFFYDYRIGKPTLSGGLDGQQDTYGGYAGQAKPYTANPSLPSSEWPDVLLEQWGGLSTLITVGSVPNIPHSTSGFVDIFTGDTPTT